MYLTNNPGFTLIELLVTMTIISILTAIAVPQFSDFRERGFDTRAISDLRNTAIAEEAYFIDAEKYLSCANSTCANLPGISALSKGVTLTIIATDTTFTGTATHPKGTGKIFKWDSNKGGLLE
ncbi:prepilin-type N-terminal cleavage/methylation domain-containing protein [Oligoflexia bacterium]|nr:prepilin-type N-terminal cleavage/methylation domain-containing protein [Oligoflexia bacterium]